MAISLQDKPHGPLKKNANVFCLVIFIVVVDVVFCEY